MRFANKLLVALALGLAGAASAQAASSFDGRWSVELVTQQGNCNPTYNWSVAVTDGRIADAGFFVQAAGAIDRRGKVQIQLTHGSDIVAASGRASGEVARGAWRSPTRQCSGAWIAQRS